jgi:rod shape determining protein RodA
MRREMWRNFDFLLFGAAIFLAVFGVMMIRSAIAGNEVLAPSVSRQAIFVAAGIVLMIIVSAIDYHFWGSLARLMYIIAFISLAYILIVGTTLFGSARWFDTGVILIQPSELAKILMIIVLADYFARSNADPHDMGWILRGLLLTMGVVIWIVLQPNLSTSIVIMFVWISMLWLYGLPVRYVIILGIIGILIFTLAFPFLQDYQQARIINFLFPDPEARHGNVYNVQQALITIGSGGLLGQGYGHGTQVQLRFLKVRHTDFIFSAMAEEFGFIGTVLITSLLVIIIIRSLKAARESGDAFGSLIAYSYAMMIFFQTAVNIGVNLNVMPVSGLPLPFLSYGGSSLLSSILGVGLVQSVNLRKTLL